MLETDIDLLLAGVIEGNIGVEHLTEDQLLELELALMDNIAIKRAGHEFLVHWEVSGCYH